MLGRICSDGSAGGAAFIASDGAGGNSLVYLDSSDQWPRIGAWESADAGNVLDE